MQPLLRRCRISLWGAFLLILLGTVALPAQTPSLAEQVDALVAAGWQSRGITPAELCDDATFLRRVMLDLHGTIPTAAEVRAFLADAAPDKRAKKIDALLAAPGHARHLQHWLDVLLMERQYANYVTEPEWREYLRTSVLANKPWDQMAREMLGTDGVDPATRPALRFILVRTQDSYRTLNPSALTRDIGRLMLGVNLQCAQCHNHPSISDYKQADYFGLLAFVNRSYVTSIKRDGKDLMVLGEKPDGNVSFTSVFDPQKVTYETTPHLPGAPQLTEPTFEKGQEYQVAPAEGVLPIPAYSRRAQMAQLLPAKENRAFARNMANRLWEMLLGRGVVHPVEVHHSGNPPSHPELMELLTTQFIDSGYDMRHLIRQITLTRTYQLASTGTGDRPPPEAFARAELRSLRPEALAFSMMQATGFTDSARTALGEKLDEAILYNDLAGAVPNFAKTFGAPAGSPESGFQASLEQALFMEHGGQVKSWLDLRPGDLRDRVMKLTEPAAIADEIYVSVLSRSPTPEEVAEVAALCQAEDGSGTALAPADRAVILQDLVWALLASAEFRFNH